MNGKNLYCKVWRLKITLPIQHIYRLFALLTTYTTNTKHPTTTTRKKQLDSLLIPQNRLQHFMVQSEPENHRPFASQFNGYQILFQRRTKVSDIRFKFNLFCNHKKTSLVYGCIYASIVQCMVEMGRKKIL